MPKAAKATEKRYHHGDLRAALIRAAIDELSESGIEALTLRGCARRAGVSHAAPAHHFGDITGLLTAVATEAQHRLAAGIAAELRGVSPGSPDHLVATAMGYVRFAVGNPGVFKLMFRRERLNTGDIELIAAGRAAFGQAVGAVGAFYKTQAPMADPKLVRRVIALWSTAHGLADLLLAEQLAPLGRGMSLAQAILPDIVREQFSLAARNRDDDLSVIAKAARAAAR